MSAFTYSLKGRDRKLASLYAERRVCPWGSSKSYSFQKKYKGALWRFWFTVLSFGIFGYEPKKFLKWGKLINIALEMVFAGGGEARRVRIQDASILTLSSWCFNFLFFFFSRNPSLQELFLHSQIMKVGCRAIFARNSSFLIKCYQ